MGREAVHPGGGRRGVALGGALVLALALPLAAQEPGGQEDTGHLRGVVVDALAGAPISGALVVLDDERRAVLTDSAGAFDFGAVWSGSQVLTIQQYGYETQGMHAVVPVDGVLDVEIPLPPKAVLVDGISVVADRLETMKTRLRSRRRAVAAQVRAFDQERLVRSPARDVLEFLRDEARLQPEPCRRGLAFGAGCVRRRGRVVEPQVFVDEVPLIGGLDYLMTYRPYDLYLVEVYSSGLEIRAYTHMFMERMARGAVALIPINLPR